MEQQCNICSSPGPTKVAEKAQIRSNVRAFAQERFLVWRCGDCRSIHASDEVELERYYARYPFHDLPSDWRTRAAYDNQLRRLVRAGLRPHHSVLDYGCGGGNFVKHLRLRGYPNAVGFDAYSEEFADRAVLDSTYDCVVAQDLIEHVPSPLAVLDEFDQLTKPGGIVAIGTPNAAAIDLAEPERTIHALHLPYHRHIFSKRALFTAGSKRGWELERYYPTEYGHTPVPFFNAPFMSFYMGAADNSIDSLFEPPRIVALLLRLPIALFWGLCGYFLANDVDVMAVFRRPLENSEHPTATEADEPPLSQPLSRVG